MRKLIHFATSVALLLSTLIFTTRVSANFDPPPPAPREETIIREYLVHEWWLLAWADNAFACRILVEEEGQPRFSEVNSQCPPEVFELWVEDSFCEAAVNGDDLTTCSGYYLYYVGSQTIEREETVELPAPSVRLSLDGCSQTGYEIRCDLLPILVFSGIEPLSDQHITAISYLYRGQRASCEASTCSVPLLLSPGFGDTITFSAQSSYGDATDTYEALIRVKPTGDGDWQVDVLSTQWDPPVEVFAREWNVFPPLGESPAWLSHPANAADLHTEEPYQYLAGQLIGAGVVDASSCADGGLLFSGYASQCGFETAYADVIAWQNSFDNIIFEVALRHDLSPWLIKNLIARESQFWPGAFMLSPHEYGLARLTETGADTILMWNEPFYLDFCGQFLIDEVCQQGYNHITPEQRQLLRGALSTRINLACSTCEYGFDFERIEYNIEAIAESLLANAAQVGHILTLLTKSSPGANVSYEDLWRFTLVNYNAGPGCLAAALKPAVVSHSMLVWASISGRLRGDCALATDYVESVTGE